MLKPTFIALFLHAIPLLAQIPGTDAGDPIDLARLKNYSSARVSSSNRFVASNDDSKRIMPGGTLVMANLQGGGMISHIWLTVADNEFGWPRLLRLRVYYDGRKTPSEWRRSEFQCFFHDILTIIIFHLEESTTVPSISLNFPGKWCARRSRELKKTVTKDQCLEAVNSFRVNDPVERSDEDLIATIHLMNFHGVERVKALDQSSQGGNDNGIDAWHFKKGHLSIYQSKLTASKAAALKGFEDLSRARDWLEQVLIEGEARTVPINNCLYNLLRIASDVASSCTEISFVLLSPFDGEEIRKTPDFSQFGQATGKSRLNTVLGGERNVRIRVDADTYDLDPRVPVDFKEYPVQTLPEALLSLRPNAYMHLAYVPLYSLVELYRQRRELLFEKNVRMYLGGNKKAEDRLIHPMRETLKKITSGEVEPSMFGFNHVGVTLSAMTSKPNEGNVVALENPCVINGCQTISIADEHLRGLEREKDIKGQEKFKAIKVVAKLVVGVSDQELREISNANNRQNPIENWQLFSNEPIHVQLEQAFKEIGVFYERQQGKFHSLMKKPEYAKVYHGTNGTYIKVIDLGQAIAMAAGHYQLAAKPSEIFSSAEMHEKIFPEGIPNYVRDAVLTTNLLKSLKRGLDNYLKKPVHAQSYAPIIFKKGPVRMRVFQLGLLYLYQHRNHSDLRLDFATSLKKNAGPKLTEAIEPFFRFTVSKVTDWYRRESHDMSLEISSRKMDLFFREHAVSQAIDLSGAVPFTASAIDWDVKAQAATY